MKTGIRWLLRIVLLLVALAMAGTFIPRPLIAPVEASSATATHRILLLSGPIHTDIAIPLDEETRAAFSFLDDPGFPLGHPNAEWLVVGWGRPRLLSGNADLGGAETAAGPEGSDDRSFGAACGSRRPYHRAAAGRDGLRYQ